MINNSFFRLLFDYRGTVTRRQYWAVLVVILVCLLTVPAIFSKVTMMNILFTQKESMSFFAAYSAIGSMINLALGLSLPLQFIALYISLIVTVKRCRALCISMKQALFHGISTYFILPCLYAYLYINAIMYSDRLFNDFHDDLSFTVANIIFVIFSILGIISVIYLSLRTTDVDRTEERYDGIDSIKCLFYIARLILGVTIVLSALVCYIIAKGASINQNSTSTLLIGVLLIAYVVAQVYIYVLRAKDAGVESKYVLGVFSVYVLLSLGMIYLIMNVLISPITVAFIDLVQGLLFSTIFILTFVLIALPTKSLSKDNLIEENDVVD